MSVESPSSLRALVVDDDETSRDFFTAVLSRRGFAVDVAKDGMTALGMMQATRYDVAVCDVRMPRLDGISVARNMLNHANRCPVIFATASEDNSLQRKAESVQAAGFLLKPVPTAELVEQLVRLKLLAP